MRVQRPPAWEGLSTLQRIGFAAAGLIMLGSALFLGAIVLAFLLGLFLIAGVWLTLRRWWLGSRAGRPRQQSPGDRGRTLEGEFEVIDKKERRG